MNTMQPNPNALSSLLAVLLAMLSITLGASLAKSLFPLLGAAGTTLFRLGCAALLLSLVFRIWRAPLDRRTLLGAIPYGLSLGAMNLLFYLAIARIPLGVALAIEFIGPLTVALLSSRHRSDFIWLILAIAGLLLLPLRATQQAIDPLGAALALGAGLFWGLYMLTGKRAGALLGAQAPALGMWVGTLLVLPFGLEGAIEASFTVPVILTIIGVGLLSSAIPYSLEMFALRRLPLKSYGILTSGEPAMGALMGLVWLGEQLPPSQWLGIAAIIAASMGTTWQAGRRQAGSA
ncbi:EamA family transporter [Aeromonas caviae]|uniref:EamA family transporter n=1 Tax=Aeromonas caviae TaxID=648 RepID=UPI0009E2DD41|nr:EamA family transporter [Aeromonas caviae]MCX4047331.1 EamA family transporter [Aeromonas caviae]MCX4108070.1 EamA family transporter [Aeromonas caviae]MDX7948438.1 EamA family transporter [Aeromonas caviae]